jgi:apolipoprotein N-acyltransferase
MVAIVFAAFLASAAFEPIGIWFLAPIGFALFFRKLISTRRPIIESFVFGFLLNAIVLYWAGKYVGALPWLLLSTLQAIFYLPAGLVQRRFKNVWLSALVLLIMEELRARFPFGGFGWTRIAFSQVDSPALSIVALGGVIALSVFTVVVAVLLARLQLKNSILIAALFITVLAIPDNPRGSGSIQLLAIQGNTPEVGLGFNSRAQAVFDLHVDATREFARGSFDAIVWPENAVDIDPALYPEVANEITSLVGDLEVPLIAGVVAQSKDGPQNASILYSKNGVPQSVYVKRGLTPFGEYMPFRSIAELINPYAKNVVDFIPGDRRVTHKIQGKRIGPIICYEIIDDDLVRDMAKNSDALIVQTNSATFANTAQSKQQLAITRIRAVEHSRYILSVSTIGISAFIDNNGKVINKTAENKKSSLLGKLLLSNYTTPIDRYF